MHETQMSNRDEEKREIERNLLRFWEYIDCINFLCYYIIVFCCWNIIIPSFRLLRQSSLHHSFLLLRMLLFMCGLYGIIHIHIWDGLGVVGWPRPYLSLDSIFQYILSIDYTNLPFNHFAFQVKTVAKLSKLAKKNLQMKNHNCTSKWVY